MISPHHRCQQLATRTVSLPYCLWSCTWRVYLWWRLLLFELRCGLGLVKSPSCWRAADSVDPTCFLSECNGNGLVFSIPFHCFLFLLIASTSYPLHICSWRCISYGHHPPKTASQHWPPGLGERNHRTGLPVSRNYHCNAHDGGVLEEILWKFPLACGMCLFFPLCLAF